MVQDLQRHLETEFRHFPFDNFRGRIVVFALVKFKGLEFKQCFKQFFWTHISGKGKPAKSRQSAFILLPVCVQGVIVDGISFKMQQIAF